MKISDLKTYILGTAWRNLTFVELHADDGLVGLGEVRMLNHTDALLGYFTEAAPNHILGTDLIPFQVRSLLTLPPDLTASVTASVRSAVI